MSTNPTVLVVDDDALIRCTAAETLEDAGFQVVEARDADDALRILASRDDVRLMFTDVNMPGDLDGIALATLVHERWPNVRLVVTSGRTVFTDDDLPDDGRFLPKPYRLAELTDVVKTLVG